MIIETPEWVKHAVFYQIFPDRFARSDRTRHVRGIQFKPWGTPPAEQGYQGGDLYGIVDKLDYINGLGITALYLNPIFSAASNHRYNAYTYMEVDPLLGGNQALRELLDEAHKRNIKVVLDGVFNHTGRGFWAFHHILENGAASPYYDWFTVHGFPLHPYPEEGRHHHPNYSSWWNNASLPKLNTNNPGVRNHLLEVARYWIEFGADGWRLDVPEEIHDDPFWREFRLVVKGANPEAYIVAEIWHEARHWLQGDMFDAVMNYMITGPIISFFGSASLNRTWHHNDVVLASIDALEFVRLLNSMFSLYDWEIHYSQMNMLDSHDMPRALWLVNNDMQAFQLAVLCQMTMPGAPCVYYGDEVGLSAGTDPHCREAFPWNQPGRWDSDLLNFYRSVIALRHTYPALRTGDISFLLAEEKIVVYRRRLDEQEILIIMNAGKQPAQIFIPIDSLTWKSYLQIWPENRIDVKQVNQTGLDLTIGPQQGFVLVGKE